jgi:hypothetical protein
MPANAALPEVVLIAIAAIDTYLKSLPESQDQPTLRKQFGLFCSALIAFASRHNLRYPIGE